MNRIIRLLTATLMGALILTGAPAHADTPAGDLHAFAVQANNTTCTPGYIQVNGAPGIDHWMIDGLPYSNPIKHRRVKFAGGVQAEVYAVPAEGYYISDGVRGSQAMPFYLQVNPMDCEVEIARTFDWSPCEFEDQATPCIWDAKHMGNGSGRSFKVTRHDGSVKFIPHRRAHYLLNR